MKTGFPIAKELVSTFRKFQTLPVVTSREYSFDVDELSESAIRKTELPNEAPTNTAAMSSSKFYTANGTPRFLVVLDDVTE
mmetsp:Transcript_16164/g.44757  ORF Transcript_16164/g.44757 Transcript_16164/m.44757 type:complete len:81 (-) Transcript_16164:1101-1343(-)